MVGGLAKIDFEDYSEAVPAYMATIFMPFAYSISEGIAFGVIAYVAMNLLAGNSKTKKINWILYLLAIIFILKYIYM